jgi:glycosyltransferase involved in cell wall biosynthesis
VIAIDVSAAAGTPPQGGIAEMTRHQVRALLKIDARTRYWLCYRWSRWRKGHLIETRAPNASRRVLLDPLNKLAIPRAQLLHSTSHSLPRSPRIPKAVTIHDINHVRNPHWSTPRHLERNLERLRSTILRADCVITPSRFTAEEVIDAYGIPDARVRVVPNGVDTERFHPLDPDDPRVKQARERHGDFVLAVGLLVPRKNFARLVQAVAALEGPGLVLVGREGIAGEDIRSSARSSGLDRRFTHLSSVSHDELLGLLSAARAFAVPSLYEGFGLVLAEALAAGAPVVCSSAASLPEVAGEAAWLVDASSVDALADGLRRVLTDEQLRARLGERGLARAQELSWESSARALRRVYAELLGERADM